MGNKCNDSIWIDWKVDDFASYLNPNKYHSWPTAFWGSLVNRTNINFIEDHKARFLTEIDKAEDWLELIREIEWLNNQIKNMQEELDRKEWNINTLHVSENKKDRIINAYIDRFWPYKEIPKWPYTTWWIDILKTKQEKVYDNIFLEKEYPYSKIQSGKKIVCTFHVTDTENIMVSKKVSDINPIKIEVVKPKRKAKKISPNIFKWWIK